MIYLLLVSSLITMAVGYFHAKSVGFNAISMLNFFSSCFSAFMAGTFL